MSHKLSMPLFSINVIGIRTFLVLLCVLRINVPTSKKCRNSLVVEVMSTKNAIAADEAHLN